MLSGELIRVRIKGKELSPSFVDPAKPSIVARSQELLELYMRGVEEGLSRGDLSEAVKDVIGDGTDHKLTRGLARILEDRAEFATESPIPPKELRARIFQSTAAAPSRQAASAAYQALAEELDCEPELLRRSLFADRKEEQLITSLKVPDAAWLVNRYNVSLVQSCLVRAESLQLKVLKPAPERVRQLLRYVAFHQLMHRAQMVDGDLVLTLDGPTSLLRQSTRYGMALANFFPALLLQPGAWEIEGVIRWGTRKLRKQISLTSGAGLVSHYRDQGAYQTRTEQWFEERWLKLDTDWKMVRCASLVHLGGQAVLAPCYTFTKGRKTAHLEILGFWRKGWLQKHLGRVAKHGPGNLVLAVSTKMEGAKEGLGRFDGQVISFKEVVPAKDVLAAVERCAR